MEFLQITKGLKYEEVDATLHQRLDLMPKGFASLVERSLAQGFYSSTKRANRSCNPYIEALSSLPRQPCSGQIDVTHFVRKAVSSQAEGIGPEGVGFNNFSSGLQVIVMDGTNEIRLGEVQLIVRTVDEDALGVEQSPHRAVAQYWGLLDSSKKVSRHIHFEDTR